MEKKSSRISKVEMVRAIGKDRILAVVRRKMVLADRADFPGMGSPDAAPEGIACVIVGGQIAAQNGKATGVMAGRALWC